MARYVDHLGRCGVVHYCGYNDERQDRNMTGFVAMEVQNCLIDLTPPRHLGKRVFGSHAQHEGLQRIRGSRPRRCDVHSSETEQ